MTTTNLNNFGIRELELLEELIRAMREQGLPKNFYDDEVHPMFNLYSGNVFLTNSEYQVAMMDGETLKQFYFLSYHGNEGFADELYIDFKNGNIDSEDYEQLADILEQEGMEAEAKEVRKYIEQ
jgi:uncharacterized protein YqgQ